MSAFDADVGGERITFFAERVAYWHARATLIASDLHWGKSETLQHAGVPMPSATLAAELASLERLARRTGATRLLVLGDLIHARRGLTSSVLETVAAWRARVPLELAVLRGNHDRGVVWPEAWSVVDVPEGTEEGPFRFLHAPPTGRDERAAPLAWCGHVHPCVVLRRGVDRARLPCFLVGARRVLLPAFGLTTGALAVQPERDDLVLVIADDAVVALPRDETAAAPR
jgi:DNA ligase-associated metallophosphoesterase